MKLCFVSCFKRQSDEYECASVWLCGGKWYDSVRRQTDSGRLHEDIGDKPGPEIMVDPNSEASSNPRIVAGTHESPVAAEARHSADLYIRTSWVDAALALSELEKVQCSLDMREYSVLFRLSYCTCDCFYANANRIKGTRLCKEVAPTGGNRAYYQGRAYFVKYGLK